MTWKERRDLKIRAELKEQCRINGMGAQRELKLLTENEELKSKLSETQDKFYHASREAPEVEYKLDHKIEQLEAALNLATVALLKLKNWPFNEFGERQIPVAAHSIIATDALTQIDAVMKEEKK